MKYPTNLLDYLEYTAARAPEKTAFSDGRAEVSFGGLLRAADGIGTRLAGVCAKGSPVAVIVDRTAETVAAFMGVLKAGCFYVPIDPNMPEERMASIAETVRPAAVLYGEEAESAAESFDCEKISIADASRAEPHRETLDLRRRQTLDVDPAYCIFTSGSTGVPKGIAVSHRSVIDFTEWYVGISGINERDVLANQAPFYFDLSVKDLYSALKTGATVHILPKKFFIFPILLVKFLNEKGVTVLSWATSAFHLTANSGALQKAPVKTLRCVITGGEALQAKQVNIWKSLMPQIEFINLYGPTEVTVDCTYYKLDRDFADDEAIPIGKPCENMEVILLDDSLRPVPDGEPGEICVRGSGLALGYYGDRDRTDAVFVQNPLNHSFCDRIYRTGDLGVLRGDGNIYFLSRRDNQIKHMGYRIELGEIETALNGIDGVGAGVCIFDRARDKIVCFAETRLTEDELIALLRKRLPKYMLPNVYRLTDSLPLNPNGKIDRVLLKKDYLDEKNN